MDIDAPELSAADSPDVQSGMQHARGSQLNEDADVVVTGHDAAPAASALALDRALAKLRGKPSPSQSVQIDWKSLRRAGGGDLPSVESELGQAIAALRKVLFRAMFSGGISSGELFVRLLPGERDSKRAYAAATAGSGRPPVAVLVDESPQQVWQ